MNESGNQNERDATWHARLLNNETGVQDEIADHFLPLLVKGLAAKFHNLADPHNLEIAADDALMAYFNKPHKYHPAESSLIAYLYKRARWRLLRILKGERRFRDFHPRIIELEIITDKWTVNIDVKFVEQGSVLVRKMLEAIDDPVDLEILALMLDEVHETSAYAEVLGIQDLLPGEQAHIVKNHKDRLRIKLQRKLERYRRRLIISTWLGKFREWAKAMARKAAPAAVIFLALATLIGTNLYLGRKYGAIAASQSRMATSTPAPAKPVLPERAVINGVSGRYVEKIFFASNQGSTDTKSQTHIWMMNADGTDVKQVTVGESNEMGARVSSDGTRLVFQRQLPARKPDELGSNSIWIKDLLTGAEQQVTAATDYPAGIYFSSSPAWSPDGTKIVFTRSLAIADGNFENQFSKLWIVEVSPRIGAPRQLTVEPGFYRDSADWSPDGKHIIFMRHLEFDGVVAVYSIDIETGKEEEVIPYQGDEYAPRYSPDGSKILWMTFRHSNTSDVWTNVYVADSSDPKNSQRRFSANSGWGTADWSPDGSRIVVTSERRKLTEKILAGIKKSYKGKIPEYIFDQLKPLAGREFLTSESYEAALKELSSEMASPKYRYKFPPGFLRSDDLWIANADGSNFIQLTATEWWEDVLDWARVFQPDVALPLKVQASTRQAAPGDKTIFASTVTNNSAVTAKCDGE